MRNKKKEIIYAEQLAKEMLDWVYALDSKPVLIGKFFNEKKLPYYRFNILKKQYPCLQSAMQETCTCLAQKWFNFLMDSEDLPAHQEKMAIKYVQLYDAVLWQRDEDRWNEKLEISRKAHQLASSVPQFDTPSGEV